ncbi:MAG TPA: hypothetical protein VNM90_19155, partial [Haliangium sp.]|nr:hypothetical protein [Haliangium sp.]
MGHRTSLSLIAGLVTTMALTVAGCGQKSASPAPGPTPGTAAQPEDTPPAQQPEPKPAAELPASGIEGVPGYLGFTVQPAGEGKRGWTPAHPNASVVIVDADAWSETVEEGTKFRLVSREGNLPLTLSEVSQVPYGCDGNERTMAAFRTPNDLAEQLVWILPDGNETAAVVPVTAGKPSKRKRSFTVESLEITLQLDGKHKGSMEVRKGGELFIAQPFEKQPMQGADKGPLDLTRDLEIGVPYPEAAFKIDPTLTIVVLRRLGYEGVSFDVLALR